MNRTFKSNEIGQELRNERPNNWVIVIDGREWKVVSSRLHADAIVRTLVAKGKRAYAAETGASVSK